MFTLTVKKTVAEGNFIIRHKRGNDGLRVASWDPFFKNLKYRGYNCFENLFDRMENPVILSHDIYDWTPCRDEEGDILLLKNPGIYTLKINISFARNVNEEKIIIFRSDNGEFIHNESSGQPMIIYVKEVPLLLSPHILSNTEFTKINGGDIKLYYQPRIPDETLHERIPPTPT